MKLIQPSVTEYIQQPGLEGVYKAIRDAAVICYQTDIEKMKLTPEEFVNNVLLVNGHTRPLEFGTVYMKIPKGSIVIEKYFSNLLWNHIRSDRDNYYVTTNLRVIMQGWYESDQLACLYKYDQNWLNDVKEYICEPTPLHHIRKTFTMLASRGATDDFRTHITLSSICESTRFCNYSKGKFGSELTFIDPVWWKSKEQVYNQLIKDFEIVETKYIEASTYCTEAQQLKRITPLGIKAELRLCGFKEAWDNFLWRRCDSHADPECQLLANLIKDKFNEESKKLSE